MVIVNLFEYFIDHLSETQNMNKLIPQKVGVAVLLPMVLTCMDLKAQEVYVNEGLKVNLNLEIVGAVLHSDQNYAVMGNKVEGNSSWSEGYAKYGTSLTQQLVDDSQLYGALDFISSATWGDGDAAGVTLGNEHKTNVENAYVGWKSGNLLPKMGTDGVDISIGKRSLQIGEGFLILGDMFNYGNVDLGENISRGGAYYLAARKSFAQTAKISLGGSEGVRSDLIWLKSNNKAQAKTELTAMTLEKVSDSSVWGLTWIHGLDQDEHLTELLGLKDRRDMDTVSIRFMNTLGYENLKISGEYAYQDSKQNKEENAWYVQGSWKFSDVVTKPSLTYRYSQFSEQYDPLFYGSNGGYGTWFQGEVAANYGGPFSSNTKVHYLSGSIFPREDLELGTAYYNFKTIDKSAYDYSGSEVDIYARWMIKEHYFISPLVGFFNPKKSSLEGGLQLGEANTNVYSQLILGVFF